MAIPNRRLLFDAESDRNAHKGEAMYEIAGGTTLALQVPRFAAPHVVPSIGSTTQVGSSVKSGRSPPAYDSSPMNLRTVVSLR